MGIRKLEQELHMFVTLLNNEGIFIFYFFFIDMVV